jgi:iron complex outermembrane receptor protein
LVFKQNNYNVGNIDKGIELLAEVIAIRTNNVEWRIGGNVTFQNSKITEVNYGST